MPLTAVQMTVTYQVGGGGHLDIDFWVSPLVSCVVFSTRPIRRLPGVARGPRQHGPREAHKTVAGNCVHHREEGRPPRILLLQPNVHRHRQDGQVRVVRVCPARARLTCSHVAAASTCTASSTSTTRVRAALGVPLCACLGSRSGADIVSPIEREIRTFSHGLASVKDEQEYIVIRERTHRNTAESTNDRVKWWSILQAGVLFSVVAWQVYYLKVRFHDPRYRLTRLSAMASLSSRSSGRSRYGMCHTCLG